MRFRLMASWLVLVTVVAVACDACGGGTKTVTRTVTAPPPATSPKAPSPAILQPAATCPVGKSFMGCSTATSSLKPRLAVTLPAGKRFPDVSNFQGHPNWAVAKPFIAGAAAKLGEGSSFFDPDAAYNVGEFKRLGIPYVVYWFVRPSGCAAEGNAIRSAVQRVGGVTRVVLDEEVSGISGYAACLNPYVRSATGQDALVYRSSGNNFDSSSPGLKCWVAAYGPSSAPACSGRTRVAWQFTDGRFGFPVFIPGVGQGDVSVDLGGLLPNSAPPKPAWWSPNLAKLDKTRRKLGGRRIDERDSVRVWVKDHCLNPTRRAVCKRIHAEAGLEKARIDAVARRQGWKAGKPGSLGGRNQTLQHLLTMRKG